MQSNELPPKSKPRSHHWLRPHRLRFSLRTLLLLMLVLGAFFGWFGKIAIQARRQQKIVGMIHEMGGEIAYRRPGKSEFLTTPPRGPWLIRDILGRDAFGEVAYIHFRKDVSDSDLARLVELAYLELVIAHGPKITDIGLAHLAGLPKLTSLNLDQTTITKAGLKHLVSARHLRELTLGGPAITNETLEGLETLQYLTKLQLLRTSIDSAGLALVGRLTKLENLDVIDARGVDDDAIVHLLPLLALKQLGLQRTSIGDDGVRMLTALDRIERLTLWGNKITDAGFANVTSFKNLTRLELSGINDSGMAELKDLLHLKQMLVTGPNITDACIEDLVRLARASRLEHLDLTLANITQPAVTALSHRIPECEIKWCQPNGGTVFKIKDGLQSSRH
jgi:hypothetical protein